MRVNVTADQPGATFKVDGVKVSSAVQLKPGSHVAEASLDGYASDSRTFAVSSNNSPITVAFTLRQSLPELRFSSGITGGSVIFDSLPPVDLQEGNFTKSDIPPGTHNVRVMDGNHEVLSFGFNAVPGQMIKLTTPLNSRSGSGVIISSLGGAGHIYATPGLKGAVSGHALQAIPPEGLAIEAANPPGHVTVSDGTSKPRELTPDSSTLPVLTVLLSGGVESVPVTVSANAPDGALSVNGHELSRKLVKGSRVIYLREGSFDVAVTADGYRPAVPQHILIKAGDSPKHLDFQLTPIVRMSSLNVTGAPAEAAVFLDDLRVGTVSGSGVFTKDVSPGAHVIAVRKAGLEEFKESRDFKAGENMHLAVEMHAATGGLTFHLVPASAKVTVRRDSDIYTPANGQTEQLAPGSYTVTASADDFRTRTETIQVEAGKPIVIDWALLPAVRIAEPTGGIPFINAKAWTLENGWLVHNGLGLSIYTGNGTHTFDILKHKKGLVFGTKRVFFWADFTSKGNYTQYGLDGRTLYRTLIVDGKPSGDTTKVPFGQDNGDVIRMVVELSPNSFIIKNRAGKVIDSIYKNNVGRFGFVDDVTVTIAP